jgi:hypothetical protein
MTQKDVCFLVEGDMDRKLIEALISYLTSKNEIEKDSVSFTVKAIGGWSAYRNEDVRSQVRIHRKKVLIVDADKDLRERKQELTTDKESGVLDAEDFFVIPNGEEQGTLEQIVSKIANNQDFINCFLNYKECVGVEIDVHSINYAYAECFGIIPKQFDFSNSELFNLNNEYLNPLKDFIKRHLS